MKKGWVIIIAIVLAAVSLGIYLGVTGAGETVFLDKSQTKPLHFLETTVPSNNYTPKPKESDCRWEVCAYTYHNNIPDGGWFRAWQVINDELNRNYSGWEVVSIQYIILPDYKSNNNLNIYHGTIFIGLKRRVCK